MAPTWPHLGELCAALAVVTFEPGSHELITGRRRGRAALPRLGFVPRGTWTSCPSWRRYSRALKQRNALLKARAGADAAGCLGARIGRQRRAADPRPPALPGATAAPAAASRRARWRRRWAPASLDFQPGWRRDEMSLADALLLARERDLATGFTSVGPHRADWRIGFSAIPGRAALSRGQAQAHGACRCCWRRRSSMPRCAANGRSLRWTTWPRNWTATHQRRVWRGCRPAARRS